MSWQRSLPGTGSLILTPWQTGGTPGSPTDALPGEEVMIYHFHEYISFWTDFWTARFEQTTTLWLSGSNIRVFYLVRVPACFFIAVKQVLLSILFDISVQHWTYPEIKQNENSVSAHVEQNWVFHHFIWRKQWLSLSLEHMSPRPLILSLLISHQLLTSLQINEEAMLRFSNTNCRKAGRSFVAVFFYDSHSHSLWSLPFDH